MDGSAAPFVDLICKVGLQRQTALLQALIIDKSLVVYDYNKYAGLMPADEFSLYTPIDFDNSVIGLQSMTIEVNAETFNDHLASARTFGFQEQLETLRKLGLAKGGTLNSAVLVKDNQVVNEEGLRFEDEFVRHKILDTVGDISLAGASIVGKFKGWCSGHQLNNLLMRTLMINEDHWHYTALAEHRLNRQLVEANSKTFELVSK